VGYRQVAEALTMDSAIDMAALVVSVVRATRIFVRRQLTWLRDENVTWLTSTDVTAFTASVV
jgi:tRNA dimethylallyltransferase